jgi:FAD-linked sulfhydryl oxidase
MAAYYPRRPTEDQKSTMSNLIDGLATFYPCRDCAKHFQEEMQADPPQIHSQIDLSMWFCRMHNRVNARLGKDVFDCGRVLQRWKGDESIDGSC